VFDETYQRYLGEIRQVDFLAKADVIGLQSGSGVLVIPLYDKIYRFDLNGIVSDDGAEPTPAVQVMICKYILTCLFSFMPSPVCR
jgi:hypothetical protein